MTMFRTRVVRADGRAINVVQRRAHLSCCFTGCCCGRAVRIERPARCSRQVPIPSRPGQVRSSHSPGAYVRDGFRQETGPLKAPAIFDKG